MKHYAVFAFFSIVLSLFGIEEAVAKRVALVIGNSAYEHTRALRNPANDAKAMAETFKSLGFTTVELALDLSVDAMRQTVRRFGDLAAQSDVAVVFYAGHGMEMGGTNYLVPTDAKLKTDRDLQFEAVTLDLLLQAIRPARRMRVVILDACRDNPLATKMQVTGPLKRSVTRGLGRIEPVGATLVAYAAREGRTAEDGDLQHSPYTSALLQHLKTPGLEIRLMFGRVRDSVLEATGSRQRPSIYGDIGGQEFFFKRRDPSVAGPGPGLSDQDETLWASIKNSRQASDFEFYLEQFPQGRYAAVARLKIRQFKVALAPQRVPKQIFTPQKFKRGDKIQDCDSCPEMIVLPAGSFKMGSSRREKGRHKSEGPQVEINFSKPFAVSKFEITYDQWEACVLEGGCNGYEPKDSVGGRGRLPVGYISFNDAQAYVSWLRGKTGKPYRLLTEAEWEYAARGGTSSIYATGDFLSTKQANVDGSTVLVSGRPQSYLGKPVEVGSYASNPFGLYDMHGNIFEWVEDCWNPSHQGTPTDGSARGGKCERRVVKGGSWYHEPTKARIAARTSFPRSARPNVAGFRVALTLE